MNPRVDELHLLGIAGSNKVMAGELSRLTKRALSSEESTRVLEQPPRKAGPGALVYPFDPMLAAVAVTYHRTSARVLWALYESRQTRLEPLFEELSAAVSGDDRAWLSDGLKISVLAFEASSVAAGPRQVVGTVKNALIEGARARGLSWSVDAEHPDLTFHARSSVDAEGSPRLVISLDLAGRPMHQRGYRTHAGEAPLREDLAANLVMLSRFDARREAFIDPLAGSGTLCIEAGLMAAGRPVWMSGRTPSAARIEPVASALQELGGPLFSDTRPSLFAAESDDRTLAALDTNLRTAGLSQRARIFSGDFRDWVPHVEQEAGLILSNPPYGARLRDLGPELGRLYEDLGAWCRERKQQGIRRAAFIVAEPAEERAAASTGKGTKGANDSRRGRSTVGLFIQRFGGRPRIEKPMRNGPLRAKFLLYDL